MEQQRDRESIGLSSTAVEALELIEEQGWFNDGQDAARFALAYAIRNGAGVGSMKDTETRWAAGNFDKTGEIRALLAGIYPDSHTPVRQMEYLVNEGLRLIADRMRDGRAVPIDLLE